MSNGLSALLLLVLAVAVWVLAMALALGHGSTGFFWALVIGITRGFAFVLWLAISDSFSRSWNSPSVAPLIYLILALGGYAVLWLLGIKLGESVPYILVGLMYLGRNIAKAVK